jgi:hypothetical protein
MTKFSLNVDSPPHINQQKNLLRGKMRIVSTNASREVHACCIFEFYKISI